MAKDTAHLIASVLLLAALVLLVIGLQREGSLLWQGGLALVALALGFSLSTRWVGREGNREEEE